MLCPSRRNFGSSVWRVRSVCHRWPKWLHSKIILLIPQVVRPPATSSRRRLCRSDAGRRRRSTARGRAAAARGGAAPPCADRRRRWDRTAKPCSRLSLRHPNCCADNICDADLFPGDCFSSRKYFTHLAGLHEGKITCKVELFHSHHTADASHRTFHATLVLPVSANKLKCTVDPHRIFLFVSLLFHQVAVGDDGGGGDQPLHDRRLGGRRAERRRLGAQPRPPPLLPVPRHAQQLPHRQRAQGHRAETSQSRKGERNFEIFL